MTIKLGYSPCPNDTFMFDALTNDRIEFSHELEVVHRDVSTLNEMARNNELDVTKASIHAIGHLLDDYVMLRSGAALGENIGPIIVANEPIDAGNLGNESIAIPGELTTAYLLLRLFDDSVSHDGVMSYEEIMPSVQRGEYNAGLVIHEGRFTYPDYDLVKVLDLGEWWSKMHTRLVPLGGIIAKRDLGVDMLRSMEDGIRRSIKHGYRNPEDSRNYVKRHAQEMSAEVTKRHIDLYVNDYSVDIGDDGEHAVREILGQAHQSGITPEIKGDILLQ